MRRVAPLLLVAALAGCGEKESAEHAAIIKVARTGMNTVRGVPGGKTASFTAVRVVGGSTVCGMIDGNDGDSPRPFSVRGTDVTVADRHDPSLATTIAKTCAGTPVHNIVSRNAQFTDLDVAD